MLKDIACISGDLGSLSEKITPLIITFNEAENIDRNLQRLTWTRRIVIIDSFSTDKTLEILKSYPQVEVFQRTFDSFANQCNYGLSKIQSEWVLSLDADYILSDELIDEIKSLPNPPNTDSYLVSFKYCVFGQPLRGTLLPSRQVLYRLNKAIYIDDGHSHKVKIDGTSRLLKSPIYHDDRKPLSRWLWAQDRYMIREVEKFQATSNNELSWSDRLRKQKILAPFVIFLYCLILKGGILDGWRGWYYALQRMLAETLLSIRLIEAEYLDKE